MKFKKELVQLLPERIETVSRFGKCSALYTSAVQKVYDKLYIYEIIVLDKVLEKFLDYSKDGYVIISGIDYQYKKDGILITKYIVNKVERNNNDTK